MGDVTCGGELVEWVVSRVVVGRLGGWCLVVLCWFV